MKNHQKKTLVPVIINGSKAALDVSTIPPNNWYHCHGKTEGGVQVNSLQIAFCGDSAIIKRSDGFGTSYSADELEVLSAKFKEVRAAAIKAQTA